MNSWAQGEGQPGLGYIFWREENDRVEGAGPIAKNIGEERTEAIRLQLGLKPGDACFFAAGDPKKFASFAGDARTRAGEELDLVDRDRFELAWIVDFPFYEWDEEEKKIDFGHNPFTMPRGGLGALENEDPLNIKAWQYDLVCNGYEIASGGIRNHLPEVMVKAFGIVGLDARSGRGALRRPLPRLPLRRPAAWRHGGRHRPHRHAARRREEPARGHHVPDEPAGRRTS